MQAIDVSLFQTNKCAFVLLWMGGFWITGCISLYATSFLPMFLGPVMGLGASKTLAKEYMPVGFIATTLFAVLKKKLPHSRQWCPSRVRIS